MALGIGILGLASFYSGYYANRASERKDTTVAAAAQVAATDEELDALGRETGPGFATRYACEVHDSVDAVISDPDVDAVVIGTLLARRADDAVAALEAGLPVLTGKPAAASQSEAERIARAAAKQEQVAATTAPHRHDGRIQEARSRVAAGEVGSLLTARASVYHGQASADGIDAKDGLAPGEPGPVYTMGFYTADLLNWFFDGKPVTEVAGDVANTNSPFMEHPDVGTARVRYADDSLASMSFTMCNAEGPGYGWEIELYGTEGTIRTGQHGHEGLQWGGERSGGITAFGRTLDPVLDHQFDEFIDAVGNATTAVPPTPSQAAAGIGLCDAWSAAAADGRPVRLNPDSHSSVGQ